MDQEKNQTKTEELKKEWVSPEVIDLDMESGTLGAGAGPTAGDGGPAFTDYFS